MIEISGVTDLLKNVMDRAACALAGMIRGEVTSSRAEAKKAIAMTMLGPCEQCASSVRIILEGSGYQVTGFSAAGISDRAMEEMMTAGLCDAAAERLVFGGLSGKCYFQSGGRLGV